MRYAALVGRNQSLERVTTATTRYHGTSGIYESSCATGNPQIQDKLRVYRLANGTFYAEEYQTRPRESLQTKMKAEARRLIAAKNQAAAQPVFNLEMAKVYLKAHNPQFCERT